MRYDPSGIDKLLLEHNADLCPSAPNVDLALRLAHCLSSHIGCVQCMKKEPQT